MEWQDWGALAGIATGLCGIVFGWRGIRAANHANQIAEKALGASDQANELSAQANAISERSVAQAQRAADAAEDAVQLQKAGMSANEARERRIRAAHFVLKVGGRDHNSDFQFVLENQGPAIAREVEAMYLAEGKEFPMGSWKLFPPMAYPSDEPKMLTPIGAAKALYGAGHFVMTDSYPPRRLPSGYPEQEGEVRLAFTDENGPEVRRWRVVWPVADFYEQREFRVEAWPEERAPAP